MVIHVTVEEYIPTNAYFYIDETTNHGFLIDPGAEADKLLQVVDEKNIVVEKILITHGHFDHIGAANELHKRLNAPIIMRRAGQIYAEDAEHNLSADLNESFVLEEVDYVDDYSLVALAANPSFGVKILPLPGHTSDGTVFYAERDKLAFVGDSIFKGSYGRTDLYGGDEGELVANIVKVIFALPDETVLYTGHDESTTVGEEKARPFWQRMIIP